jgi:hypothetical protein
MAKAPSSLLAKKIQAEAGEWTKSTHKQVTRQYLSKAINKQENKPLYDRQAASSTRQANKQGPIKHGHQRYVKHKKDPFILFF